MKTKFLYILLFATTIAYAQFPFNGLQAAYEFQNGAVLVDGANNQNFTQTGTNLTEINDRFGNPPTSAVMLNGDYLTRPNITPGANNTLSFSFWIKTNTSDNQNRTIIDDLDRTGAPGNSPFLSRGYYVGIANGKIEMSLKFRAACSTMNTGETLFSVNDLADDEWHHVYVSFTYSQGNIGPSQAIIISLKCKIDDLPTETASRNLGLPQCQLQTNADSNGNVTIANSRNNDLPLSQRYTDAIDNILIYNRELTDAEITSITTFNNFCFAPNVSELSATNITQNQATINFPNTGTFDLAYHKTSEPFSNATILSSLSGGTVDLINLEVFTSYEVYLREQCATTTPWSRPLNIETTRNIGRIYVDANAAGNNNGTSWANAYTELADALPIAQPGEEIWVTAGTYHPAVSDRNAAFVINQDGVELYGGFTGTETARSQRDPKNNITTLSGDLLENDDTTIDFINTTKDDNSYTVLYIDSSDVIIDGVTISNGFANINEGGRRGYGAGIFWDNEAGFFTARNCIIKDNIAFVAGGGFFGAVTNNALSNRFRFEACEFTNNLARGGSGIYAYTANNIIGEVALENCLFNGNTAKDEGGNPGFCGSAAWLRAFGTNSFLTSSIINSTFVNNVDTGTQSGLNNFNRASLGLAQVNGTHDATVANVIFYDNEISNGLTSRSITGLFETLASNITVNNSIDEQGFSAIASGDKTNTSNSNPMFEDAMNNNFTLMNGSPAIDAGDNNFVTTADDLGGNQRIVNTTVDMGAFEFDPTLSVHTIDDTRLTVHIFPNPGTDVLYIQLDKPIKSTVVFNMLGKKVLETSSNRIDVSALSRGMYIVTITTNEGVQIEKQFIKQ